jgi:dihydroneopterin aldolase
MTQIYSSIAIQQFELHVSLGWPDDEREQLQPILLDILIRFPIAPRASETDQLDDTFCYALLTEKIKNNITSRTFRLIEFLGREIYQLLKSDLPKDCFITIGITKNPPIPALKGGVQFWYGDEKNIW